MDLVYTLFVGSFYIVDLSQSRFWIFCVCPCIGLVLFISLSHVTPYLSFLSALLYRSKHLACFLHLLCWILVVFVHWIFIWHVPCTSCVGSYLYSYIGSSFGMFLAPPVLDLICIRTLDLRLLCSCSHFGYQHTCILDLGSFLQHMLDLITRIVLALDLLLLQP